MRQRKQVNHCVPEDSPSAHPDTCTWQPQNRNRVEELAGKVDQLRNVREEDHCRCHDNREPRPRFTIPLLDLEELGTRVV